MLRNSRFFTYGLLVLLIVLISFGAFYLYNKYGRPSPVWQFLSAAGHPLMPHMAIQK